MRISLFFCIAAAALQAIPTSALPMTQRTVTTQVADGSAQALARREVHRSVPNALASFFYEVCDKSVIAISFKHLYTLALNFEKQLKKAMREDSESRQHVQDVELGSLFILWQLEKLGGGWKSCATVCGQDPVGCFAASVEIAYESQQGGSIDLLKSISLGELTRNKPLKDSDVNVHQAKDNILKKIYWKVGLGHEDSHKDSHWIHFKERAEGIINNMRGPSDRISKGLSDILLALPVPAALSQSNLAPSPGSSASQSLVDLRLDLVQVSLLRLVSHVGLPTNINSDPLLHGAQTLDALVKSRLPNSAERVRDVLLGSIFVLWQLAIRVELQTHSTGILIMHELDATSVCFWDDHLCLVAAVQIAWKHLGATHAVKPIEKLDWQTAVGSEYNEAWIDSIKAQLINVINLDKDVGFKRYEGVFWGDFKDSAKDVILHCPQQDDEFEKEVGGKLLSMVDDSWVAGVESMLGKQITMVRPRNRIGDHFKVSHMTGSANLALLSAAVTMQPSPLPMGHHPALTGSSGYNGWPHDHYMSGTY